MQYKQKAFLFLFFLILSISLFALNIGTVNAAQTEAPFIYETGVKRESAVINHVYVEGESVLNSEVLVYIDGSYVGTAQELASSTATSTEKVGFYYEHGKSLDEGEHTIMVLARNKTSMVLSSPIESSIVVPGLSAPTLIKPTKDDIIGTPKPQILGLTISSTTVHVFIDGKHNGKTEILTHESGTANFAYKPFLNLEKGWHTVWTVAEDELGRLSGTSNVLSFKVEDPMPAPTLFEPVVNSRATADKPFIVGLAKNDSTIKVYIDKKLDGEFKVLNHESGTANFAYQPSQPLTNSAHLIYTTALDQKGKESIWSNLVSYKPKVDNVPDIEAEITEDADSEDDQMDDQANIEPENLGTSDSDNDQSNDDSENDNTETLPKNESNINVDGSKEGESVSDVEVLGEKVENADLVVGPATTSESLITGEEETAESDSALNQNKDKNEEKSTSKIKPELIIFIAFILGVIIWIIWVNRELVREKNEASKNSENEKKDNEKSEENIDQKSN